MGLRSPVMGSTQRSKPFRLSCSQYSKYLPSEDQSRGSLVCAVFRRSSSCPVPFEGFRYKLLEPSRSELNTIREPSGDHTGALWFAGSDVSRMLVPRDGSITTTSSPVLGSSL